MEENDSKIVAVHTTEIAELKRQLAEVYKEVAVLKAILQKYHGFVGGIIFVVSGVWLFLTQAKDVLAWLRH